MDPGAGRPCGAVARLIGLVPACADASKNASYDGDNLSLDTGARRRIETGMAIGPSSDPDWMASKGNSSICAGTATSSAHEKAAAPPTQNE